MGYGAWPSWPVGCYAEATKTVQELSGDALVGVWPPPREGGTGLDKACSNEMGLVGMKPSCISVGSMRLEVLT
jgi:hypothetical protein